MESDEDLLTAVLVEVPISDIEFPIGEGVTEAAVVGATQLEDMPDALLFAIGLFLDLNEVNNAGHLLEGGVSTNGFHGGSAFAVGVLRDP